MFETVELGQKLAKNEYEAILPDLRLHLLEVQRALLGSNTRVFLIFAGVDAAGKGELVNKLSEWLDARGLETNTYWQLSDEERERPAYWRYWRTFPSRGRIGIHFAAWYQDLIPRYAHQEITGTHLDSQLNRIAFMERMLAADGALILKFWLHLSKKAQKKRFSALESDPQTKRRVTKADWKNHKHYEEYTAAAERVIRHTSNAIAPWTLIDAGDKRYRDTTVAQAIVAAISRQLEDQKTASHKGNGSPIIVPATAGKTKTILDGVDLTQTLDSESYERQLSRLQARISRLVWAAYDKKRSSVVVFEGWDAAGKGGCIRRMTVAMDARLYRVISIAAPTDEEKAHHYLWRFWRHIPRAGFVTAYDRSWYGRVLVERVENFATPAEWQRAYSEINDFEEQLTRHGNILTKFFLHISQEEQLRRFKEREIIPHKQHKITEEDWRNREKWGLYDAAINEMVARTSTEFAPWCIIPSNDKKFARIEILKTYARRLEQALDT